MAGVTSEIFDQDQVDEPQVDIAGMGMGLGVVEVEVGGDHTRTLAGALKVTDHIHQRFAGGDNESGAVRDGVAVAFGDAQSKQNPLEPDALGGGGVFDQPDRCGH